MWQPSLEEKQQGSKRLRQLGKLGGPVPGNCLIIGSKELGEAKNDHQICAGTTVVAPEKGDIRGIADGVNVVLPVLHVLHIGFPAACSSYWTLTQKKGLEIRENMRPGMRRYFCSFHSIDAISRAAGNEWKPWVPGSVSSPSQHNLGGQCLPHYNDGKNKITLEIEMSSQVSESALPGLRSSAFQQINAIALPCKRLSIYYIESSEAIRLRSGENSGLYPSFMVDQQSVALICKMEAIMPTSEGYHEA